MGGKYLLVLVPLTLGACQSFEGGAVQAAAPAVREAAQKAIDKVDDLARARLCNQRYRSEQGFIERHSLSPQEHAAWCFTERHGRAPDRSAERPEGLPALGGS